MERENFKKGIEDIIKVQMTEQEKKLVLGKLESYVASKPLKNINIRSPWYIRSVYFATTRTGGLVLSILFISLVSLNSVFVAKNSLPGDKLYSLKVDVMEPLEYSLTVDSVSKTNLLLNNLDTRLKEVEALQSGGRLTDSIQSDLEKRLKNNTKKIAETSNKTSKNKKTKSVGVTESSSDLNIQNSAPTMMMTAKSISTSSPKVVKNIKENKRQKIIRSTKESVERIKKDKNSNDRLIKIAEESIKDAEDSLGDEEDK